MFEVIRNILKKLITSILIVISVSGCAQKSKSPTSMIVPKSVTFFRTELPLNLEDNQNYRLGIRMPQGYEISDEKDNTLRFTPYRANLKNVIDEASYTYEPRTDYIPNQDLVRWEEDMRKTYSDFKRIENIVVVNEHFSQGHISAVYSNGDKKYMVLRNELAGPKSVVNIQYLSSVEKGADEAVLLADMKSMFRRNINVVHSVG